MKPMTREEVEAARRDGDYDTGDLIDALVKENEELLEALTGAIWQACYQDGVLDSMALSAYAEGLRLLGDHQIVSIKSEYGRRVIALPPEEDIATVLARESEKAEQRWAAEERGEQEPPRMYRATPPEETP